jgi:hypothetical protein
MDFLLIEILLWVGFALLIWALREGLSQLETEFELHGPPPAIPPVRRPAEVSKPQKLLQPIGQYRGRVIHDYAIIDGRSYRFAHVCPWGQSGKLPTDQRWISPGLVYVECLRPAITESAV